MQEFVNECQINAYSLYIISYLKDYIFAASGNARKKKTLYSTSRVGHVTIEHILLKVRLWTRDLTSRSCDFLTHPIEDAALDTWPLKACHVTA